MIWKDIYCYQKFHQGDYPGLGDALARFRFL